MDPFAVERWEGEGGAPATPWPWRYRAGRLSEAERQILESLGAAVVHEWRDLPTDVQRSLFRSAADKEVLEVAPLRENLARFLHTRRNEVR
jgi:hypothetical protein